MPTSIVPIRVSVKSFEEVRLALQRLSADINLLGGTNPFTVTFTQATGAEAKGGGIVASKPGQFVVSDPDSDFAAFQPGTDLNMLRVKDSENRGLEWRSPAQVLGDIGAAAVAHIHPFFHGTFLESFNALATSNGTVVTMTIEQAGGGDLTMLFSDGATTLDCTPLGEASIPLTVGSDTSPTDNFIYVLQSTKALTKSTSDWPPAGVEHIKVGYFLVPSAGYVQAKGVYANHNLNDHAQGTDNQGHLSHITDRLRSQHAIYKSGIALTITIGGGTTVDAAVTAGIIYQMHQHATPALDTAAGDEILVINQNGAAWDPVTDLELLTNDANGVAVKKYFNWVIGGIANKSGEYSPLILNLPTGSYNQQASAEGDVSGYDVLTIPHQLSVDSQTGYLIARVTMSLIGGTWAHVSTVDLRGATPQTAVGGVGGVATEFPDNAFGIFDEGDSTKELVFQLSGITTGNTRTITAPDADLDLGEAVTAAAASAEAGTVQVSAGVDRTIQDAANIGIFGNVALASDVTIVGENDGGTGFLRWKRTDPRWQLSKLELPEGIVDGSANEIIKLASVGSAVNEITVTNAATTNDASVIGTGEANAGVILGSSGTGAVSFTIGGSEVGRFEGTNKTFLIGRTTSDNANFILHADNEDAACNGVFRAISNAQASHDARFIFQRARYTGSPSTLANANSGDRVGTITSQPRVGGGFSARGSVRWIMASSSNTRMELYASSHDLALTLENGGDITIETANARLGFGGDSTNYYIQSDTSQGMAYNCATALSHRFHVAGVQNVELWSDSMEFRTSGGIEGIIDWSTTDQLDFKGGTQLVLSVSGSSATAKLSFFGATPVIQASAMAANLTTITHTAPGTPDYALADLIDSGVGSCFGFATKDEGNTLLSVVKRLQVQMAEVRALLAASGGYGLTA